MNDEELLARVRSLELWACRRDSRLDKLGWGSRKGGHLYHVVGIGLPGLIIACNRDVGVDASTSLRAADVSPQMRCKLACCEMRYARADQGKDNVRHEEAIDAEDAWIETSIAMEQSPPADPHAGNPEAAFFDDDGNVTDV